MSDDIKKDDIVEDESLEDSSEPSESTEDHSDSSDSSDTSDTSESADEGDVESTEDTDYQDQYLRLQAEFMNYKRRAAEEQAEFVKYASSKAIESILPGIDNLSLAMNHIPEGTDSNWIVGMEASLKSIIGGLGEAGVTRMDLVGKAFDAATSEALSTEAGEKDVVLRVVQDGYMIHDRVLRLAKVIVGNGEES